MSTFDYRQRLDMGKALEIVRRAQNHNVHIVVKGPGKVIRAYGPLSAKDVGWEVLRSVRQVEPGSMWGDEGIAAIEEERLQRFDLLRSGVSGQDLRTLQKAKKQLGVEDY